MAVGPYDFNTNMPDPGQAFAQAFQQAQQQRVLQQQQQAQMDQQQRFAQWQERLRTDYRPETLAQFGLEFPQQAKAVQEAFAPLQKAERENRFKFNSQVFDALSKKDVGRAKEILTQRIAAAKNTMGRDQEVAELEYWLPELDRDPDAAISALAKTMYFDDADAYKALYATGKGEMTGFQKDLIAAGVDPTSEEGKAKAKEYVSLKVDPIVQMPTPNGGQFIGRQSEYYRMFGGGAPAPQPKPIPIVGEVKNGYRFNGGDPSKPANWSKVSDKPLNGVPAPKTGEDGMPATLTPAQYRATVQSLGKAKTDDWMRRNNITVSGR
jgi:hypothetical protein